MDAKADSQAQLPTDSIQSSGNPLGFMVTKGTARPAVLGASPARDVVMVEARQFGGHQKEAVVREGTNGSQWRMVSDEGKHLKGTDLAPFLLGFFNAGIHADLGGRIIFLARDRGIALRSLNMDIKTRYSLTGSFTRGDAIGTAEPIMIEIDFGSAATDDDVYKLVSDAAAASPAIAALRTALTNTFAIYVNGRRRAVQTLANSPSDDAPDPFRTYANPPAPLAGTDTLGRLIHKTGIVREGGITLAPAEAKIPTIRVITGNSAFEGLSGVVEVDTYSQPSRRQSFRNEGRRAHRGGPGAMRSVTDRGLDHVLLHDANLTLYRAYEAQYSGHSHRPVLAFSA